MGRHSRKGAEATRPDAAAADPGGWRAVPRPASGGRRRRQGPVPPADGHAPFSDAPQVRGGHPEQHEPGGGWGTGPQQTYGGPQTAGQPYHGATPGSTPYAQPYGAPGRPDQDAARERAVARQVYAQQAAQRAADGRTGRQPAAVGPEVMPGPRREFVDAFDADAPAPAEAPDTRSGAEAAGPPVEPDDALDSEPAERREPKGGKGRTFTGIAAAAVTTVLAVVVAGQVAEDSADRGAAAARASGADRGGGEGASRSDARPTPERPATRAPEVKPLSYGEKMAQPFTLAADLKATGKFEAVPGLAKAPGRGQKYRYRIDVEKGLSLDAGLFAEAVQKTLNDDRSWAHNGAMTFERISSGGPDFVITLASPGTTGEWCAKSGLDTTIDNVSCDSASTDRVMINAYRWAQGSATFGPKKLLPYRQMLINHEVGHRLGYNHVSCRTPGALAPVMQQQTKSLDIDGIKCKPNPWVYPGS
ncbi:hypothetical protein AMK21_16070 [Streptomyces sp. CB00316]|uniref:DUF3152 domain-containing protein n=1 Tax=unclassified Streptomyces TaxID=2593676 RepID=UPI000939FF58|nr:MULTISPECIES: DUF3152 domain-containing protein [unclassified Streptomyces]MBT2376395.1 DUF3152 domain-containing protein [Streptomyces sp. ISL-111]OKJ19853.1 hypothetical protein AMK21_16070 [Streptomyces sp. CB00316]